MCRAFRAAYGCSTNSNRRCATFRSIRCYTSLFRRRDSTGGSFNRRDMVVKTSVGWEITAADLRVAVVRSTLGKLRLMQTAVIAGFMQMAEDEKPRAVTDLVKKYKISSSRVHLSLPRDQGIVRQIDFPVEV